MTFCECGSLITSRLQECPIVNIEQRIINLSRKVKSATGRCYLSAELHGLILRKDNMVTEIITRSFGSTSNGDHVTEYVLKSSGVEIGVIDYGAIVTSIKFADKYGSVDDVVTGFFNTKGKF